MSVVAPGRGRRAARPRSRGSAPGGPDASTCPFTITVITSASANTASMSCSTSRIACAAASRFEQARPSAPTPRRPCPRAARRAAAPRARSRAPSRSRAGAARRATARRPGARRARGGRRARGRACARFAGDRIARGVRSERERTRQPRLRREPRVLEHGEGREDVGLLVAAADAHARAAVGRHRADLGALQPDAPRGGLEVAGEQVDERRLARAVGPEQRVQLAASERDVDALAGGQAAEEAREAARLEDSLSHRGPRRTGSGARVAPDAPARPA